MADPILDDDAFRSAVDANASRVFTVLADLKAGDPPMHENTPQPPPGSAPPNEGPAVKQWREKMAKCGQILDESMQYVEQLADASTKAAQAELTNLEAVMRALEKESDTEMGEVMTTIRGLTEDWSGSPASRKFQGYLNDLETALEYQYRYAGTMHALMHLHCELIYTSREGELDLFAVTLKALNHAVEEKRADEEHSRFRNWKDAIDTAFAIAGGAASGGLVGAVAGAITALGGAISSRITDNAELTDPFDIMDAMRTSIIELRRNVRHEENVLLLGFRKLSEDTHADRKAVIAPLIPG
jgi:hypothetical protein